MNTPDQVYTLLRAALLKARADGLRIVTGTFGDGKRTCCALNALMRADIECFDATAAAMDMQMPESSVTVIADGFDDNGFNVKNPFFAIGQKLRAEFIEQKGEV